MSEYTEQAEKFLRDSNLEFRAVLVGSDCPTFCEDAAKELDMEKLNVFPRKTHIHGKHYRCTISGKDRGHVSFDFWNSYADSEENAYHFSNVHGFDEKIQTATEDRLTVDREAKYWDKYRGGKPLRGSVFLPRGKRKTVQAYDLLAAITKNDPGTFEDFCSEYGYDTDSRKAEEVYRAVVKEYAKVRKFFTPAELEALQEIQ